MICPAANAQDGEWGILFDTGDAIEWSRLDGSGVQELYRYADFEALYGIEIESAMVSSNGTKLVLIPPLRDIQQFGFLQLFLLDLQTQQVTQITELDNDALFAGWSSDSAKIAYFPGLGYPNIVYVFDLNTGEQKAIAPIEQVKSTYYTNIREFSDAVWSPDGEYVAIEFFQQAEIVTPTGSSYDRTIVIAQSDGSEMWRLQPVGMHVRAADWLSPDALVHACQRLRVGLFGTICQTTIDGKSTHIIADVSQFPEEGRDVVRIDASPDGRTILFQYDYHGALYALDIRTRKIAEVPTLGWFYGWHYLVSEPNS